jgi:S-adenosylmethionine synthetase
MATFAKIKWVSRQTQESATPPAAITDGVQLRRSIYSRDSALAQFGKQEADFSRERTDKLNEISDAAK